MPLGDFGVFIARDKLALAAHRHDLGAGVLCDHGRVGIAGRGGASAAGPRTLHRDERRGSVRRAGIVGKAAVDFPAVELRGDLVQGHVLAVAVDDLQGRELLGRLQVIDIPAPVGAHEMPHRPLGVFITGDELALAAHVHGLAGGILFDHGQLGVRGRRGRGRLRGLGGRGSQRGRRGRHRRRSRSHRVGRLGRGDRKSAARCCGRCRLLCGCGLRRSGCLRGSHGHGLRVVLLFPAGAQRQQGKEDAEDCKQFLFHSIDLSQQNTYGHIVLLIAEHFHINVLNLMVSDSVCGQHSSPSPGARIAAPQQCKRWEASGGGLTCICVLREIGADKRIDQRPHWSMKAPQGLSIIIRVPAGAAKIATPQQCKRWEASGGLACI